MAALHTVTKQSTTHLAKFSPRTTILSIDGGGVRGIIPIKVLEFLEKILQTHLAISHAFRTRRHRKSVSNNVQENPCDRILLLSLGTGSTSKLSYNAKAAASWGGLSWIYKNKTSPILDIVLEGSDDMVDYNVSVLFDSIKSSESYLRIQATGLEGAAASMDNATQRNLNELARIGKELMEKDVSTIDMEHGTYASQPDLGTNGHALERFAKMLVEEKYQRMGHLTLNSKN